jgi:hypothetical protein
VERGTRHATKELGVEIRLSQITNDLLDCSLFSDPLLADFVTEPDAQRIQPDHRTSRPVEVDSKQTVPGGPHHRFLVFRSFGRHVSVRLILEIEEFGGIEENAGIVLDRISCDVETHNLAMVTPSVPQLFNGLPSSGRLDKLSTIPCCVDMRNTRPEVSVDADTTTDLNARFASQVHVRTDTGRQTHDAALDFIIGRCTYGPNASIIAGKYLGKLGAQAQIDSVGSYLLVDEI